MLGASIKRFRRGDNVRCLHDPSLGIGCILAIATDVTVIYLGKNEWVTEYVPYASVSFGSHEQNIPLKELIRDERVALYESLRPGDFITFGKVKRARALVLRVEPRRGRRPYVTALRVVILTDGIKRNLSVKQDVTIIQRMDP